MSIKLARRTSKYLNASALTPLFVLGAAGAMLSPAAADPLNPNAVPTGGNVVGGQATINQSGNTVNVNQSTNRTVIDWRSFDIGSNAQTNFNQPNSGSIAVNRVNSSTDPTRIEGGLHANGQVWVLNPNGVLFGKTARVDAAGIVATTANVDTNRFMAGDTRLNMTGADHGAVVNEGHITVGQAGLAAFVAPSVRNSGTIEAKVGKVTLAAGTSYTLDLAGDHLVEIGLGANKAVVDQSGRIVNPGGTVSISARAASAAVDAVINVSGIVDASSVQGNGGNITLAGDTINTTQGAVLKADAGTNGNGGSISAVANNTGNYAGTFSAKGGSVSGDGGSIETSGADVHVASDATITASATNGKAGTWTLDPLNVTINAGANNGTLSGSTVTTGTIATTLAGGTSVHITTSQTGTDVGDLTLAGSINATSSGGAGLELTGRHLSATGGSTVSINGGALTLDVNAVNTTATPGGSWINDAVKMIGTVSGGTTINLGAGTYTIASGGTNYIFINKSNVALNGAGQGATIIDASAASTYGMRVWGDNVSLSNFTLKGSTGASGYGIKVEPSEALPPTANDRVNNFSISNVTETGSLKNGLDLNGVIGATINNVSISNTTAGTGIAITDSKNVTITNTTTTNNAWGGIALYEHNSAYNQQVDNITIDGTNTLNEANDIYAEDESASLNFGSINLAGLGIQYVGKLHAGTNDDYTFFQKTAQGAINLAAPSPSTGTVQGYSGVNLDGNNIFTVGIANGGVASGTALSINTAVNAAANGGTINVLAGTYTEQVLINKSLTLAGAGEGQTIIDAPATLATSFTTQIGFAHNTQAKAVVAVTNGATATIENLTVDGRNQGNANNYFLGIGVNNANVTVNSVHVTGISNNPLGGIQSGVGIGVFNEDGVARTATVENSIVDGFQKNGIALQGGDLTVDVENNTVIGAGHTPLIAQNGIELFGLSGIGSETVSGTVANNTVSGVSFDSATNEASGILLIGASGTSVTGNTVTGTGSSSSSAGISVDDSNGVTIANNTFQNLNIGIDMETNFGPTNGITVTGGTLLNNAYGVFADPSVSGVSISGVTFTNNDIQFQGTAAELAPTLANNTFDRSVYITGGDTIFGHIQNAVDSAIANDTVNVGAGTYEEQVVINKSLTLAGAGIGQTIIEAPDTLSASFNTYGTDRKPVVLVEGGGNVSLSGFTVDGLGKGAANYSFEGIGIFNTNAAVDHVDITGINDGGPSGAFDGVQQGVAIADYNVDGTARTLSLTNSSMERFQKNATAFNGGDLTVDVENNVITGAGNTGVIAQNGIQLRGIAGTGNGIVTGTIANNTISGVSYANTGTDATGILLIDASGTVVQGNSVTGTGSGGSSYGFYAIGSNNLTLQGNGFRNLGTGIYLDAGEDAVNIVHGVVQNSGIGLFADGSVTNLSVSGVNFSGNEIHFTGPSANVLPVVGHNTFDSSAYATGGSSIYGRLQTAIADEAAGSTLNVAGTFANGSQVVIDKNLTIVGNAGSRAVFTPGTDFIGSNAADAWFLVDAGVTFNLSNVVFNGAGNSVYQALRSQGNTTINNVDFRNIAGSASGQPYRGVAIESFGGTVAGGAGSDTNGSGGSANHLTVTNSTFENIGREGILVKGTGATADITGNTYTGKGVGDWLDYGIEIGAGGSANITGNTITGNLGVASTDGSTSAGIMVTTYYGAGSSAAIQNNTVTGNTVAVDVGFDGNDTSVVTAHGNNFGGNGVELESTNASQDFTGNWWGTTNDSAILASMTGAEAGSVNFSSFLESGTDTSAAAGFQGDFSRLTVTSLGGGASRINEAVNLIASGGTISVRPGDYTEGVTNVDYYGAPGGGQNFGLLVGRDNITIQGVDASNTVIADANATQASITAAYQTGFGAQDFISGSNVTITGLKFLPAAAGDNKMLEVIGDNFTLRNSLLDVTGNPTAANIYIDDFQNPGHHAVDSFTILNNVFKGGTEAGAIVVVASGAGLNTDASHRLFENNTIIGSGVAGQRGFQIQGREATVPWQQLEAGSVTVTGNTFTNVDIPVRTVGDLTQSLDWNAVFNNNTFTNGAAMAFEADGVTAQAGLKTDVYDGANGLNDGTAVEYKIFSKIQDALGFEGVTDGDVVRVGAGTYTLPGELDITKQIELRGAGIGSTIINSQSTGYGILVDADNTTLSGFTFNGSAAGTYGIKVEPDTGVASDRLLNFAISNVAINGSHRTGLDLNGVSGATISNVSVTGTTNGNGIALTDSANVTLINDTTTNNAWGGLALYQTNRFYDQQETNISVDASNTFNEVNGVYAEDESATTDLGALSLAGYGFAVKSPTDPSDLFTFFQKTQQDAFDFAVNPALNGGHVALSAAYVEGWNGTGLNNIFSVGFGNLTGGGTQALSVNAALAGSTAGSTIDVNSGSYAETVDVASQRTLNFGNVTLSSFTLDAGAAGSTLSGNLAASAIALNGAVTLGGNTTLDTSAANGAITTAAVDGSVAGAQALTLNAGTGSVSLGNLGATTRLGAVVDASTTTLTGTTYDANSLSFGALTLTGNTTLDTSAANGAISTGAVNGSTAGAQSLSLNAGSGTITIGNVGASTRLAAVTDLSKTVLAGGSYVADSLFFAGPLTLTANTTLTATGSVTAGTIDGTSAGAQSLTINAAAASLGNLGATTRLGAVTDLGPTVLIGTTYAANSLSFGALTLAGNTTLNTSAANGAISTGAVNGSTAGAQSLSLNAGSGTITIGNVGASTRLAAVTDLSKTVLAGGSYVADSLFFAGPLTLTANTTLTATGSVTAGTIDGTSAGAQALTINAAAASLGNLGATTRLGAVTDLGPTVLIGTTYAANSLSFGALTLAGNTTLNTSVANGAISTGAVNGSTAGAQSLSVNAGTGTVSLGNVGAGTRLASLTDASKTTLTGGTYNADSIGFSGALTLTQNTALTSAGTITTATVDGTAAGAQALTITASAESLGNLGATTRLGAVTLAGNATLAGSTYDANSFTAGGNVTLTQNTVIDTTVSSSAAGNITVNGSVLGTTNGGQSLTLHAGPGTGAASANGEIALQNVGTSGVRLNNLTVSGNDFSAQTVYLAGAFTSTLTGNQVFSSNTLNAGSVNGTVGGNASGPINATGAINLTVGGNLTGTITGSTLTANVAGGFNGTVNASDTGFIHAHTINGTFDGGAFTLIADDSVGATVIANSLDVRSPSGTIGGNWTTLNTDGSGSLIINRQATLGDGSINPQQLVVENFLLPNGTTVAANGAITLPPGLALGLIAPGGPDGKPQMILVHSVQRLGQLLYDGYVAIIIDLNSGDENSEQPIQLSQR